MTLEDRVTKLEERAAANDEAHENMQQILGTILEIVRDIRRDQKYAQGWASSDSDATSGEQP